MGTSEPGAGVPLFSPLSLISRHFLPLLLGAIVKIGNLFKCFILQVLNETSQKNEKKFPNQEIDNRLIAARKLMQVFFLRIKKN